jgi:pimeloyl-ACP methyl ester carboxylesterase
MDVSAATEQRLTLVTSDGVRIDAVHLPCLRSTAGSTSGATAGSTAGSTDRATPSPTTAFVVLHGFTGHWRQPRVWRIVEQLASHGGVIAIDMRGHGRSGGLSTVGDAEVLDADCAVGWARELGYDRVVMVGFSMGASVAVRQAAIGTNSVDALVCVSGPAYWFYRGTRVMRLVHHLVLTRPGRAAMRARGTRISGAGWPTPPPLQPAEAAALLAGIPFLVVHGAADHYFPLEHPRALHRAAEGCSEADMWLIPGFGHAEAAIDEETVESIARWGLGERFAVPERWLTS